jgi:hypothetical protein
MARTKNTTRGPRSAAPSAAHAAPAPAPAPTTPPAPADPAAAVHAALAASPGGATTARIASAAGISRPAARDALNALETVGAVTRTKGGKPGIPDTWTLTAAEEAGHEPGAYPGQDDEPAVSSQPGDDPAAGDHDGPGEHDATDGPGTAAAGQATPPDGSPADGSPGEPDTAAGPEQGDAEPVGDAGPGPGDSPAAEDPSAAGEQPDPALVAEVAGRIEQIQSAASAAAVVLTGGDLRAALAGLDEVCDQATQGRRALKAAAGGKKAPTARPGGLREKVLGHLRGHPDASFTPHEIHKVLDHSSGAIANALDTLVKLGYAELATEKPRKFRFAGAAAPAGDQGPAETGADGSGAGDDTDLAGAA